MKFRALSTWALLVVLAAGFSVSSNGQPGAAASEDRNSDGQADVWQFYDEDGELIRVLRDRNFDGFVDAREVVEDSHTVARTLDQNFDRRFEPCFSRPVVSAPEITFNVALPPFLLPEAVFVGDQFVDDRAPQTLDPSSESRTAASVSGRAPPAAL